jgi:hypothetical protein
MNKIFSQYVLFAGIVSVLLFAPQTIFATELTFKVIPSTNFQEKDTIVEVRIDPQSKKINVVEGVVSFSGSASESLSVQVENGNSVLPLWPTPPKYISEERVINFVGGVPNGFDNEGLLFLLRLSSAKPGDLNISYSKGNAYLNDGKGTKENISSKPLQINLDQFSDDDMEDSFSNKNKYVILLLVVIIFIFIVYHGYKRITKK